VELELVDVSGGEVLLDRLGPAADLDARSPDASLAWSRADPTPLVTKKKVGPPSISSGGRG
jgi:hypothetical protein